MERRISEVLSIGFADDDVDTQYRELEARALLGNPLVNLDRLRAAYLFARKYHGEQRRNDGSPYITHPIATAMNFVTEMMVDEDAVVACLLHDVIED
ncbi:MAG: HD domain-containing protein, partial [Oscillospiraceae bacterium]|nr:HD domain-containing protein [Oscillospiraceae bacterium]